jgi:hypothetical protein
VFRRSFGPVLQCLLVCVSLGLVPSMGAAAPANWGSVLTPAQSERTLSFTPDRLDECRYFLVTETGLGELDVQSHDWMDQYLVSSSAGLMMNVSAHQAVGATLDAHYTQGAIRFAPALRYRYWLGSRRQSAELSVSLLGTSEDQPGVQGTMFSLRYSPIPELFLQVGGCQVSRLAHDALAREQMAVPGAENPQRSFGGAGLGGVPGAACWGVELILISLLAAVSGAFENY